MAFKNYILVCGGSGCESSKADLIFKNLQNEISERGLSGEVQVIKTGCFGFCEQGPIVKVLPEESFYVQVTPEDAKEIVAEHIVKGRPVGA
jgi:NADP-reducing hydrogenase subunit HndC